MTKRAIPTWAEPHDTKSHLGFAVGTEFAQKLRTVMDQAGLTASDLARRIWGDAPPTASGYVSAKNRDRISKYLAGKVIPDADTLKLLAQALNVAEESLAPQVVGNRLEREHPEVRLTVIAGHRDRVHLTVNSAMPLSKAIKIIALIEEPEDPNGPKLELREPDGPPSPSKQAPVPIRHAIADETSISVFKTALETVQRSTGAVPKLSPKMLADFEAAIINALASTREKIGEDRETINHPASQPRLPNQRGRSRGRHPDSDTMPAA